MNLYDACVPQLKKMLRNLDRWLDAAMALAEKKKFDANWLLTARLAPDQFPLIRQIQSSCDQAQFAAARLTGREPPKHTDTEQTVDELRVRIQEAIAYLDSFSVADFADAETRPVTLPFLDGKFFFGKDYLIEFLLPNFYFHIAHAYAILRHNGVELGKADFMGALTLHDR